LFHRVRADMPRLRSWVDSQFTATVYEDPYSPFCLIAENNADADAIHQYMEDYCKEVPDLQVVRNDVYARFAHTRYNKGTALAELSRRLNIPAEHVFAAGDHLNDLPMLEQRYARYLAAPANAVDAVKELVASQGGFVSALPRGHGVAEGLKYFLEQSET
jgi:hydroxymethylpyrimidine pyrophosphatase-like HAD family hydrolase